MNDQEIAHRLASRYNQESYDDLFQEAMVIILGARIRGVEDPQDLYSVGKYKLNLHYNYQDRLVPIPQGSGSKDLKVSTSSDAEVFEYTMTTPDHSEEYERQDVLRNMMKGVANLPQSDQLLLNDIYFKEMTLKKIGEKHGISKQALHKKHSRILKTLSKVDDK